MSAGIVTIPLEPNSKQPFSGGIDPTTGKKERESWLYTSPSELWEMAPRDANLAVKLGQPVKRGKLAAIDGDSPQTAHTLTNYLNSIGINPATVPQVATPSKSGRHFYVATTPPDWYTWGHLAPDVGAGELRVNHCYTVAPVSVVTAGMYQFVNGDPGWLALAPFIEWRDLVPLLKNSETQRDIQAPRVFPVRLVKREPAPRVFQVFDNLAETPTGNPVPFDDTGNGIPYHSRSEAEFGICVMLALAGWEFDDVYHEFKRRNVGKFAEKGKHGRRYLETTYTNALAAIASNPTRRELSQVIETVKAQPWPGRAGLYTQKTLLAMLAYYWQFATRETTINQRDLVVYTGLTRKAVGKAIPRLMQAGYIQKTEAHTRTIGTTYALKDTINHNREQGEREPETLTAPSHAVSELFTSGNYGITAGAVADCLTAGECLTVATLAERTGKHAGTIRRAVEKLVRDGILAQDGTETTRGRLAPRYRLAGEKLAEWAEKWETGAQLERRRERIAEERRQWSERRAEYRARMADNPAKMPHTPPKTPQDARNDWTWGILPYTPQNTPVWALPGNETGWLSLLAWVWEKDKKPQTYQTQEEYFRHDAKVHEFTLAELAEIDAHPWPELPPF